MSTPQDRAIELSDAVPLIGLPYTGAFASPFTCSSDGQLYVGEYAFDKGGQLVSPIPDLYRVSPVGRQVKHVAQPVPVGYKSVSSRSFFAGENALVSLIAASEPTGTDKDGKPGPSGEYSFLSTTNADGDHAKLIHLNLDFDPMQVGIFASGEFLVVGTDPTSSEPVIALLNSDGQLMKHLEVFPGKADGANANDKRDSAVEQKRKPASVLTASMARLAPWGADILLVLPGVDGSTVHRFRASGQVESVLLHFPEGEEAVGVLGSGGRDTWVVRTRSAASTKKVIESHVIENPDEFLYEVSPGNREILSRLLVHGPHPGEVACAADGKLTAIWVSWPKNAAAPDGIVLSSAPR